MNSPLANILMVDDRAEDRAALEAVLAPLGQNLVLAESGKDALRHILKTEFAVILLDVEMPIMDGLEIARMIRQRERSQQIPIIFITGVAVTSVERFKGYAAGAVDYMLKPAIPDILRWNVQVFVDLYRLKAVLEDQIRARGVANQALLEALAERDQSEQERAKLATEVKALSGLLPICAGCKKIRDDQGHWSQIEVYITKYGNAIAQASLRKNILFAQHNLVTDGSFNEFHVILCRNVLIYLDETLESRVGRLLNQSLVMFGFLCLGAKESLRFSDDEACFEELDMRNQIYRKTDENCGQCAGESKRCELGRP